MTDKFLPGNGGAGASWFGVILKPRTSAFFPSHSCITARCCTLCNDRLSYNEQKYIYAILKADIHMFSQIRNHDYITAVM